LIRVIDHADLIDSGDASIRCRDRLAGRVLHFVTSSRGAGTLRR
jgi:hypothetical protein